MTRPWETLERVGTTEGPLELRRRGADDFLITVGRRVLMNSAASRSEMALGRLACEAVAGRRAPHVLVGGLGMGCTLRAALDVLPGDARVAVVELNEVVVRWCRGPLAPLHGRALEDRRVDVRIGDVAETIATVSEGGSASFDAILLDLYEGPPRGARARRHPHFGSEALRRARSALVREGVLALWCEDPDPSFERSLRRAGFAVRTHRPGRGGRRHAVVVARAGRPARGSRG